MTACNTCGGLRPEPGESFAGKPCGCPGVVTKPGIVVRLNRAYYEFEEKVRGLCEPAYLFLGQQEREEFSRMVLESLKSRPESWIAPRGAHEGKFRGAVVVQVYKESFLAFGL